MFLSILAATLPLIVLLIGIPLLMKPAAKVAPIALLVTVLAAILVFHFPAKVTVLAALQGGLTGLFPIMYIPFGALVVYNVLKATGWMDKMQGAMANLTVDRRAQALLIAFGFGAFLEGICGFGAPVAIPASILIGLGYNPMMAALVCLVANTGPVPFGSLAIPTVTLAKTTGLDVMKLSQMTGRFMAPLALIMAFATVYAMSKSKGMKGALGTILVTGLSFSITQFLVSNFIGADLTSVLAGLVCLVATAIYLNFQKHAQPWLFEGEAPATEERREFHPRSCSSPGCPTCCWRCSSSPSTCPAPSPSSVARPRAGTGWSSRPRSTTPARSTPSPGCRAPAPSCSSPASSPSPSWASATRDGRAVRQDLQADDPLLHRGGLHPLHRRGDEPGPAHHRSQDQAGRGRATSPPSRSPWWPPWPTASWPW